MSIPAQLCCVQQHSVQLPCSLVSCRKYAKISPKFQLQLASSFPTSMPLLPLTRQTYKQQFSQLCSWHEQKQYQTYPNLKKRTFLTTNNKKKMISFSYLLHFLLLQWEAQASKCLLLFPRPKHKLTRLFCLDPTQTQIDWAAQNSTTHRYNIATLAAQIQPKQC